MKLAARIRSWRAQRGAVGPGGTCAASETAPDDSARLEALLAARQVQRFEIERWRAAFDRLPQPSLLLNPAGVVLVANRAALALLGVAPAEGRSLDDCLAGRRLPGVWREPLVDGRGHEVGTLVQLRDREADAGGGASTEFLTHISHELKSPLNTIRSYAEMLMDGSVDAAETRKEFFNVITEESARLANLIDNLLDLSKIDAGALAPERARLRPEALLGELVRAAEAQARTKNLALAAQIPGNLPAAFADKDLIGVAVSNLLSNAIKYTPEGGQVLLRARSQDESLVIEVEDTGLGIPHHEQERIFEKFYRGASADVRRQSGTGLGLALAREIVVLHAGTLTLQSTPGRGSTFRIVLPLGVREQREAFGLPEAS